MDYYAKHANGFQQVVDKLGDSCQTFTWANVSTWKIIPGSVFMNQDLGVGGFSQRYSLRFWALVAQFSNNSINDLKNALENTAMAYLGEDYQIKSVTIAPSALHIIIEASALNQGA